MALFDPPRLLRLLLLFLSNPLFLSQGLPFTFLGTLCHLPQFLQLFTETSLLYTHHILVFPVLRTLQSNFSFFFYFW